MNFMVQFWAKSCQFSVNFLGYFGQILAILGKFLPISDQLFNYFGQILAILANFEQFWAISCQFR